MSKQQQQQAFQQAQQRTQAQLQHQAARALQALFSKQATAHAHSYA